MATTAPAETILKEYATNRGQRLNVDREAGVIRDVKVIGFESVNGRVYMPEALRNARGMYEGIKVNVNHPRKGQELEPRGYEDRLGSLRNVRETRDGLRADFHFNPKHPLAEQLAWDAENAPENVGLSHNAVGRTVRRNGKLIVEEITRVNSVDLVADPATTRGLFEGVDPPEQTPKRKPMSQEITLESVTLADLQKARPDLLKLIEQQGEQAKLLETTQAENKALKEQLAKLEEAQQLTALKAKIADELKAAGLDSANEAQCSKLFMEQLESQADDSKRAALIADRKTLVEAAGSTGHKPQPAPSQKPQSAPPVQGSATLTLAEAKSFLGV